MAYVDPETVKEVKKIDLLTYLKYYDPGELVRFKGNIYTTRAHDSLKISNGMWMWWSRGIGGKSALDYLIKVKGYKFTDAVEHLSGSIGKDAHIFLQESEVREKSKALELPEKNRNSNKVVEYLKRRGIDEEVIAHCIRKGYLYQDNKTGNAVFIGYDESGNRKYASHRATNDRKFMGDYSGSDKRFSFRLVGGNESCVHVFESAIDLLSYASILKAQGLNWRKYDLLSLGGIYSKSKETSEYKLPAALENYLKGSSNTEKIILHLDNDEPGRCASREMRKLLSGKYRVYDYPPPEGKDCNDYLKIILQKQRGIFGKENKGHER